MQPRLEHCYAAKQFFRAVIDIVVKVEDAESRRMGNENVRIINILCGQGRSQDQFMVTAMRI